ncbi:MAG: homocysteine S-methyltransferase family protein [Boseongicola sp.]
MTPISRIDRIMSTQQPWLTDGGLETTMIFHDGLDLPLFASLHLLENDEGLSALTKYFDRYLSIAREAGTGFVLDTATWRSGAAWAEPLGRTEAQMESSVRSAVSFADAFRASRETPDTPIILNGVIGPAGDGYSPDKLLSAAEAEAIHLKQARWMASAGADVVTAVTMTHAGEAIGVVRSAKAAGLPVVISFTVETDGHLPTGQPLGEAIAETDAATDNAPIYYMVNCAHPDHFSAKLAGDWIERVSGIRANASRMSHAELDEAEELDDGDPEEFGSLHGEFASRLPNLRVIGGCCGTDDRHVGCAARHVILAPAKAA